jgi:hypothetical protein
MRKVQFLQRATNYFVVNLEVPDDFDTCPMSNSDIGAIIDKLNDMDYIWLERDTEYGEIEYHGEVEDSAYVTGRIDENGNISLEIDEEEDE